jgi:hypothetical protein
VIEAAITICFDVLEFMFFNVPYLKWFALQPLKYFVLLLLV